MGEQRWAALKPKTKTFVLPSSGQEVTLKDPDVLGTMLLGGQNLSDAFFGIFASATKEGEDDGLSVMKKISQDPDASDGFRQFIDMMAIEAFVEPRLVKNPEEADYETTVPIDAISFMDKMMALQELNIMGGMAQLNGLQQFRPETNGTVAPTPASSELQPIAESDSGD